MEGVAGRTARTDLGFCMQCLTKMMARDDLTPHADFIRELRLLCDKASLHCETGSDDMNVVICVRGMRVCLRAGAWAAFSVGWCGHANRSEVLRGRRDGWYDLERAIG